MNDFIGSHHPLRLSDDVELMIRFFHRWMDAHSLFNGRHHDGCLRAGHARNGSQLHGDELVEFLRVFDFDFQ